MNQINIDSNTDIDKMVNIISKMIKLTPNCSVTINFSKAATEFPDNHKKQEISLDKIATNVLTEFGIPAHIKGYSYLRDAIIISLNDKHTLSSVTKRLYPTIANKYQTTPSRVERAMRHAIEVAWSRGNINALNTQFGYVVDPTKGRPTNSEFIYKVVDNIIVHGGLQDA